MSIDLANFVAKSDQYRSLLRDSIRCLSPETLAKWLAAIEADLHATDTDVADRLNANAELVGLLSVMIETIELAKGVNDAI